MKRGKANVFRVSVEIRKKYHLHRLVVLQNQSHKRQASIYPIFEQICGVKLLFISKID